MESPRQFDYSTRSSDVGLVKYFAQEKKLVITYKKGRTFAYTPVGFDVYHGMLTAPSVGKFIREKLGANPTITCTEIK